ncbi:hypothetical protein [Mobilicoccus caccae]|uniref:3-demethylubiquinone-9 3-methyltransferase n=1 Tax=Mobilicoccus caccae TaxID=1859295 RepID=A0ABQ6IS94_9MICO|nr:hypothetical protein [Mobilicoccus caccae]GMA40354.1 hypothetical protein GCM10025883_23990 [Mobilicoccus caccae]
MECCWLTDRFGVPWQVVPQAYLDAVAEGGDRATRAMDSLLTMVKPDVAELERAIAGE